MRARPAASILWSGKGETDRASTTTTPDTVNSVIGTPVVDGGYVYGLDNDGQLRCLELATGKQLWKTDAVLKSLRCTARPFSSRHGNRYFINDDRGELIIARLSPAGFKEISAQAGRAHPSLRRHRQLSNVPLVPRRVRQRHIVVGNDNEICASRWRGADHSVDPVDTVTLSTLSPPSLSPGRRLPSSLPALAVAGCRRGPAHPLVREHRRCARSTVCSTICTCGPAARQATSWHPYEDFRWPPDLAAFLTASQHLRSRRPSDLVLNSDTFELLQSVTADFQGTVAELATRRSRRSSNWSACCRRTPPSVKRWAFAQLGDNRIVIVPGDHRCRLLLHGRHIGSDRPRRPDGADQRWPPRVLGVSWRPAVAEHGHQIGSSAHRSTTWPSARSSTQAPSVRVATPLG